jgi:hypothetical protein
MQDIFMRVNFYQKITAIMGVSHSRSLLPCHGDATHFGMGAEAYLDVERGSRKRARYPNSKSK